jgi:predicted metal-dependent phosphotriesterase family hydrolase
VTVVESALGPVDARELGTISSHDHLFINLMRERRGDGLLNDQALMTAELGRFAAQGGSTIFDLTTAELTAGSTVDADPAFTGTAPGQTRAPRNVAAIQEVSRATGVTVLLGTGHYRDPYLDPDVLNRTSVGQLADEMVRDLTEGIPGTSAKAALIGEIGADAWYVSALEERVHRAAARAHAATGAAIYTHSARWRVGLDQVAILTEAGAEPARIAVGHVDTVPDEGFAVALARRGVYIGFDTLSSFPRHLLPTVADRVVAVARAGFLDRVLLGNDVCTHSGLVAGGGTGFTAVLGAFRDLLVDRGLDAGEFRQVVEVNPVTFLGAHPGHSLPAR